MKSFFLLLTISLIIFTIYNLNIVALTKRYYILLILVSSFIIMPLTSYKSELLGIPVLSIFLILAIYINTKQLTQTIISVVLSLVLVLFIDFLCGTFVNNFFYINKAINLKEDFFFNIILYFLNFSLSYFICFIFNKFLKQKIPLDKLTFKNISGIFIVLSLLITFLVLYINSVLFFNSKVLFQTQVELNIFILLLYFILLFMIYYVLSQSFKKEVEFIHRKNEFENLKEYTHNVESLYNEMRKFKHDYMNILTSMSGYIYINDMKGLKKYFENNIISISKGMEHRDFKLGLIQNIKIPEVKGIVSSKIIRAYEKEINIFIDIAEPIDYINMNIIDICRVIGILLDNAIEAAEKSEVKSLEFSIVKKKESIAIIIINSCPEDTPPIFKIYTKNFSTKGNNRGLGLINLKQILSHYNNTFLDTSLEANNFLQFLEIKNY